MYNLVCIMPTWNVERYVIPAIESVISCKAVDKLIVVDDGSTDSTIEKINSISSHKIHLICSSKHNQYHSKNVGLMQFRSLYQRTYLPDTSLPFSLMTKYIGFLDGDDIAYPDRFDRQIQLLENDTDLIAVGGACHNITEDGKDQSNQLVAIPMQKDPLLLGMREFGLGLWNATATYKSEVFDSLGAFDYTPTMGDTEFFIRLVWLAALNKQRLANIQEPVIHRRVRSTQVSNTVGDSKSFYRMAYENKIKAEYMFYKLLHQKGLLKKEYLYLRKGA